MDRWESIYNFWSSFGIPAYEENSVPDLQDLTFPYLTYQASSAGFDESASANVSVWTKNTSWAQADALSDSIETALKDGGQVLHYDGGLIWITPGTPFAQNMGDPSDDRIKRKLLSVQMNFA